METAVQTMCRWFREDVKRWPQSTLAYFTDDDNYDREQEFFRLLEQLKKGAIRLEGIWDEKAEQERELARRT